MQNEVKLVSYVIPIIFGHLLGNIVIFPGGRMQLFNKETDNFSVEADILLEMSQFSSCCGYIYI